MDQTYSEPSGSESSEGQEHDVKQEQQSQLSRKGAPWSEEEHYRFLEGLRKLGKGNWRGISRLYVPTRTPTQVASHAQKHFLRVSSSTVRRKSRFTKIEEQVLGAAAHNNMNHTHAVPNRMPPSNTGRSMGLGVAHHQHGSGTGMSPPGMKRASYGAPMMGGAAPGAPMPSTSGSSASEGAALMTSMPGVANGVPCMPTPSHLAAMFPFGSAYAAALAAAAAYGAMPFGFPAQPGSETNTPGATVMTQGSSVFPAPAMDAAAAAAQAQQAAPQVPVQVDHRAAMGVPAATGVPSLQGVPASVQPQAATLLQAPAPAPQAVSQPTPVPAPSAADLAAGNGLLALLAAASGMVKPEASPLMPPPPAPAVSAPASAALAAAMLQQGIPTSAASAAFHSALLGQISSAAAAGGVPGAPAPLSMPLPTAPYQSYPYSMYSGHAVSMPQSSFFSAASASAAPLMAQYAQYRSFAAQPPVSAPCEVRMC